MSMSNEAYLIPHLVGYEQPSSIVVERRTRLANVIEKLIDLADRIDGDPDAETFNPDMEPSLCFWGMLGAIETDLECDLADTGNDLEQDDAEYDVPGFVVGGQGA